MSSAPPSQPPSATGHSASFVHLHLHSQYSLLDGGNRLDRLVKRVKDLGMDAVAVTDHGNLFGAAEFYTRARDAGIKPILGTEAYVAPDVGGKPSDRRNREYTGVSDGGFHLVLLAENNAGWSNLLKLASDAYLEGFYFKPRMDKQTLAQWADGLIAINGHLGSSIAHHLVKYEQTKDEAHYKAAKEEAKWHAKVFKPNAKGEPRFFLELQRHEEKLQDQINPHTIRLARELNLPLVCDNDAHFLTADDWDAHDTLCCISMGKVKHDDNRLHYPRDLYVKSPQQMSEAFSEIPEAIENTLRIADRCNVELDFEANHAPVVKIVKHAPPGDARFSGQDDAPPVKGSTAWFQAFCSQYELQPVDTEQESVDIDQLNAACDAALRDLCEAGLVWRYGEQGVTDAIRARLERELQVLADKFISAYFLIVWDFVSEARSHGIPCNARGSGVGTMVGYVLGLSNACPVEYGLLFERFTDPDRAEYPDIDIDMCQDGRGDIIEYVRKKYGHVAQIITFGTLKARAAIRDVGRVMDIPLSEVDKVCKLVGDGLGTTLEQALAQEPDLKKLYDDQPQHRAMIDTAQRLEGMARHAGVHAAGVIVATQPLDNIVPLYRPPGTDQVVTQWDGPTCEKVGLLKMDFLGLRTLSIIERAKALVKDCFNPDAIRAAVKPTAGEPGEPAVGPGAASGIGDRVSGFGKTSDSEPKPETRHPNPDADPLDLERLQYDDKNVLDLFARGETAGVFQFESGGMRNLLMAMKPDRLEDLIAANALYRPGPMELIPNYNNRKHGREQVPTVHAIVDRLTSETYGIMVYQEQVMRVLNELGGIPLRQAYTIIKAISKKKEKTINAARADFIKGAAQRGVSEKQSGELFDLILKFAGYGFNKSHSTGYAIVAYQTGYLKTYFPVQYMAAVLTYESVSTDKVVEYIDECRRVRKPDGTRGIEVKPPDVNHSNVGFTVVYDENEAHTPSSGHIRFGLSAVKGVGEKAILAIQAERDKGGAFKGLYDFCERVPPGTVNRTTIEALIKCGAFDDIHGLDQRAAMCEALDAALKAGQRAAADRQSGQMNIFGGGEPAADAPKPEQAQVPLPGVTPWNTAQALAHEKEVLGLYVSSHPLREHADRLSRYATATIADIENLAADVKVTVGGMLSRVRHTFVKKGKSAGAKMAMLTLEDQGGAKIDAVVFADTFAVTHAYLQLDQVVFLQGKVDRRREEPNIVVDRVIPVDQAQAQLTRAVKVVIHERATAQRNGESKQQLARLHEVLRQSNMAAGRAGFGRDHAAANPAPGSGAASGGGAEVMFELHERHKRVTLRVPGLRVAVDGNLVGSIQTVLGSLSGREGRCELIGPPKLSPAAEPQRPSRRQSAPLTFTMRDDGGASIDRY